MKYFFLLLTALPVFAQRQAAPAGPNPNPFAGNPQAINDGREVYNDVCTACQIGRAHV